MPQECISHCVPFVATPVDEMRHILSFVGLKPHETFVELGCGEGRNLRIAAAEFGAYAIGYEVDRDKVEVGKRTTAGLPMVIFNNTFLAAAPDIAKADVLYVYLLQKVNQIIRPMLERFLKANARVVSRHYTFDGWTPANVINGIYYYFSHPSWSCNSGSWNEYVKTIANKYTRILLELGAKSVSVGGTGSGLGIIVKTDGGCPFPSSLEGVPVRCSYE